MKKYITLEHGADFRKIATLMSEAGFQMNHATARNVLMHTLKDLFGNTAKQLGIPLDRKTMNKLLKNPEMHQALSEVLYQIHEEEKKEKNDRSTIFPNS